MRSSVPFLTMVMLLVPATIRAQTCREVSSVAEMARANSPNALNKAREKAGDSYRTRLILAYRSFQLNRGSKAAAEQLFALLPADDEQQKVVMTLGDSLCDEESLAEMRTLARVNEGFARELARAVLVAPRFLPEYVHYSTIAVGDPHSDYAVQMKRVCQQVHNKFEFAVNQLPEEKRKLFTEHVMNPNTCKVLAVPESKR